MIAPSIPPPHAPSLFDTHVHLDADAFDVDRERVLDAARAAGVVEMLIPATTASSWPDIAALCAPGSGRYAAYGLHPWYLERHAPGDLDALAAWLANHAATAIGECGLDFFGPGHPDRERQLRLLRGHFALAHRYDLPLVLHARRAFEPVILELQRFGKPLRGVVHSFSGSLEQASRLRGLGFCIGIGGPVTYARAQRLRRVVVAVPIDALLLETDAPDQSGAEHRGQRNEPAYLTEVLQCVAELRGISSAAVAAATRDNAHRLFRRA